MKFDASQFDDLELENIGQWPAAAKLLLAIFIAVMITFLGYIGFISDQMKTLERAF